MSTITTINASDKITDSRAVINTNFDNLNTDKIETSYLDTDTTLAADSNTKIPSQKAVKAYVDSGGNAGASTIQAGIVQEATYVQINAQIASGSTGKRLYVNPSVLPIYPQIISYTPFTDLWGNLGMFTDDPNRLPGLSSGLQVFYIIDYIDNYYLSANITTAWADADNYNGIVVLGDYIYVMMQDVGPVPDVHRVYRYLKSDLTSVSQITFAGQSLTDITATNMMMTSDGTNIYINYQAGNSADANVVSKYSISGTTFTYVSSVTCGSTASNLSRFQVRASDGHIIGIDNGDIKIRRFNTSGVLQSTSIAFREEFQWFSSIAGKAFYLGNNDYYVSSMTLVKVPII